MNKGIKSLLKAKFDIDSDTLVKICLAGKTFFFNNNT